MKHGQHIVCIPASVVTHRAHGLVDYTLNTSDLMLGQRATLEHNFDFRQVLPIAVFVCEGKVWAYRRGAGVGEQRLSGKVAVAVGGHWDIEDVVFTNSVIDLEASLKKGLDRELEEEVKLDSKIVHTYQLPKLICADDVEVDRLHIALITVIELDGELLRSAEDELESLGFIDPKELLDSSLNLETWTRIICQQLIAK